MSFTYVRVDPSSEESILKEGAALLVIGIFCFVIEVIYISFYPKASVFVFFGITFLSAFMILSGGLMIAMRKQLSNSLKSKNIVYFISSLLVFVISANLFLLMQCIICIKIILVVYVTCLFASLFLCWMFHYSGSREDNTYVQEMSTKQDEEIKEEM